MRAGRGMLALMGAGVLLAGLTLFAPGAAAAGTTRLVSTTGTDTGDCSSAPCATLQYAVGQANPGDTVSVAKGAYAQSVRIRESLTLVGAGSSGSAKTTLSGDPESGDTTIVVDGTDTDSTPNVTIKNLDVSGNGDSDGIRVDDADATITDCVVSDNDAQGIRILDASTVAISDSTVDGNGNDGVLLDAERLEAVDNSAADSSTPSVTVSNSDLSDNNISGIDVEAGSASVDGSTIDGNGFDGAYVFEASLDIATSTLDRNADSGLFVDSGGHGTLTKSTASSSTLRDNEGPDLGAGVVVAFGGTGDVDTSTIFGNIGQGVLSENGTVSVENSTVSGTIKPAGEDGESGGPLDLPYGGIAVASSLQPELTPSAKIRHVHAAARPSVAAAGSAVSVTGTIVVANTSLHDCNGDVTDGGFNLDSDGSCAWSATGSVSKGDAKLGPLANNGGATKTLKPAKGSDAIDAIPTGKANCSSSAADQRDVSRPQGGKCDIGAVEVEQPPLVVSPDSLPHGTVGEAYAVTLSASGGLGAPYEFSLAPDSDPLPDGLTLSAAGKISGTPTKAGTFAFTVSVDDPTLRQYTIVIAAAALPTTSSSAGPIVANTGANVAPLTAYGVLALVLGALLTIGGLARYGGRHRAH